MNGRGVQKRLGTKKNLRRATVSERNQHNLIREYVVVVQRFEALVVCLRKNRESFRVKETGNWSFLDSGFFSLDSGVVICSGEDGFYCPTSLYHSGKRL